MSFGHLLAFLVLVAAFVLWLSGRMDGLPAAMYGALAFAILCTAFPIKWRVPAA